MMLIHDLPEGIIGDLVPGENANKDMDEEEAIRSILGSLPDKMQIDYTEIWNEFKMNKTKESQLVHEIDKLELIIQLSLYRDRISKEAFNEFLQSSEKIIEFDLNRELLNEILKEIEQYSDMNNFFKKIFIYECINYE